MVVAIVEAKKNNSVSYTDWYCTSLMPYFAVAVRLRET